MSDLPPAEGVDLLGRWSRHQQVWDERLLAGLDPYFHTSINHVGSASTSLTRGKFRTGGLNFASRDSMSLASHPEVLAAAVEAVGRWGLNSASLIACQGMTLPSCSLKDALADLLCCREIVLCTSGWTAAFGVVQALVGQKDHVVLDALSHSSFQQAAAGATQNVHLVPHCAATVMTQRLADIRAGAPRAGILVVTHSLFALESSVPDLRALRDACRAYGATFLVDVTEDLGAYGDGGLGFVGEQGLIGEVDVVVGSLSRAFASTGGFVASNARGLKQALRIVPNPITSSTALSPVQAAAGLAALGIVRSAEGARRRRNLASNALHLRQQLAARAFRIPGRPSAIVPIRLPDAPVARLATCEAVAQGASVELIEYPAVSRWESRWLLRVMSDHTQEQIDQLVEVAVEACERAEAGRVERQHQP